MCFYIMSNLYTLYNHNGEYTYFSCEQTAIDNLKDSMMVYEDFLENKNNPHYYYNTEYKCPNLKLYIVRASSVYAYAGHYCDIDNAFV